MEQGNVYKMAEWLPGKVAKGSDEGDLVLLLKYLLQEAEDGALEGFSGTFLLEDDAVGIVHSSKLSAGRYLLVGALEALKSDLLK